LGPFSEIVVTRKMLIAPGMQDDSQRWQIFLPNSQTAVPEPASIALVGVGLLALTLFNRRG